jgi:lipopolysaccharide export system protein LptA
MITLKRFYYLLLTCFLANPALLLSQATPVPASPPTDSLLTVEILPGVRKLEIKKLNDSTQLQILAGSVRLKQGTSLFWCDSCVINNNTRTFEAWGHIRINDADTANVYASHLRYLIDKRYAYLDGGVRLTDGKGELTTPDLEYDMITNIGTYKHGGRVLNKKTVLTSREGYYYADLHDVYFKKNVELKDPVYYLKTDSLLYNTEQGLARFIAETFIRDSSGRTIETKEGYYNLATGKAEFGRRPVIRDPKSRIFVTADFIEKDDSLQVFHGRGNVIIRDSVNNNTIIAGDVYKDDKREIMLATNKPLMIIKQEEDSIYITADTLFSARLTDLYGKKDSVVKEKVEGAKVVNVENKDSTNRYFEAYRHVRIFSDSLQAVGDSLFYSFKDSIFRLYQGPVIWSKESQITGDTILVFTKNKKAERIKVFENSFMINQVEPGIYNQVKSTRMDGFFKEGNIDSVRATGFAECIYYIQDDDSAYTGINESKSDMLDIYFAEQALQKVVFRSAVTGTVWPIRMKDPNEMRLPGFRWLENRRPKTKYELYE